MTKPCKAARKRVVMSRIKLLHAMRRVAAAEPRECRRAGYEAIERAVRNNVKRHYLADSEDSPGRKVSYTRSDAGTYDIDKRMRTTLGRYIGRQLDVRICLGDAEIARYCQAVGALLCDVVEGFAVVSGAAIRNFYRDIPIPGSCMCGGASRYTQVYADNPSVVEMLTYDDGKDLKARALLWTARCGTKLMDRIYPNSGYHVDLMHRWASANGYLIREHNSLPSGPVNFGGTSTEFNVELRHNGEVPYFDSFHRGDHDARCLWLSTRTGEYEFESTSGRLPNGGEPCCDCGDIRDEEDLYAINDDGHRVCHACWTDYRSCARCESMHFCDDMVAVDGCDNDWCEWCAENYADRCHVCADHVTETVTPADSCDEYCEHCADRHLTDCDQCGERLADDDSIATTDGDGTICVDCNRENLIEADNETETENESEVTL